MSKKVIKTISVNLTDTEKASYAFQAAKAEAAIGNLEADRKELNTEIKNHKGSRHELLKAIEAGSEERSVECDVENDFEGNEVKYLFKGKVVDSRPMEESDRQTDFDNPPKKKTVRRGRKPKLVEQQPSA